MSRRVLVVDDDEDYKRLVQLQLQAGGFQVDTAAGVDEAVAKIDAAVYDVVLTDLHMPPGPDGIELIRRGKQRDVDCVFVMLTAQATIETAVAAIREGAFNYLRKTAGGDELRAMVMGAVEQGRMLRELRRLRSEVAHAVGADVPRPIGESPAMRRVMALAERVARSEASVLILGESGTGKELLARAIHRWSARGERPFVAFDCSALAPSLVDSELFGHEKGAFTGAQKARRGLFREASSGTLFLDEIGDIAPEVQNKLVRVLQEREIKPVGSDTFVKVDVRLLAATNKDIKKLAAEGRFREDLYYRLAVVPIELPPLRDRKEDIPELVAFFLARRKHAGRPTRAGADAISRLCAYPWPGNIRELENVVERAAILCDGDELRARDIPVLGGVSAAPQSAQSAPAGPVLGELKPLKEMVDEMVERLEREAIREALRQEGGSPSKAARRLGISRAAFYNKVKRYEIPV